MILTLTKYLLKSKIYRITFLTVLVYQHMLSLPLSCSKNIRLRINPRVHSSTTSAFKVSYLISK